MEDKCKRGESKHPHPLKSPVKVVCLCILWSQQETAVSMLRAIQRKSGWGPIWHFKTLNAA